MKKEMYFVRQKKNEALKKQSDDCKFKKAKMVWVLERGWTEYRVL